jgi:ubiquinone/menaquinone biosynthesis C-methylase UbiE
MKHVTMRILLLCAAMSVVLTAQRPAAIIQFELRHAQTDVPELAEVLALERGMTVADVGAGGGAMTLFMARWLGTSGRVYATEISAAQLEEIRQLVSRERLENVNVIQGGERSTNLPDACCDAIFLQDVYHHLTSPSDIDRSLFFALKPGGRLAIVDFEPQPGSSLPAGVPANRGGHGVPPGVVTSEISDSGFMHVRTISTWPPHANPATFFLTLFRKP